MVMGKLRNDISIKELYDNKLLSSRAFTVCKELTKNPTVNQIIEFYNEYGTFIKVRNCGFNTNIELINICEHTAELVQKLEKTLQHQ